MIWELPTTLTVAGKEHKIRTDFRDILKILTAFDDPELSDVEKEYICLFILYEDFGEMLPEEYARAYKEAVRFIDNETEREGGGAAPRTMDWEQDAPLIFSAVNRIAGTEVRSLKYLHWYTFLGYFMEIRDSTYAQVLALRQKRARGKKFEKSEREFWDRNRKICVLRPKLTEEEKAQKEALNAILG